MVSSKCEYTGWSSSASHFAIASLFACCAVVDRFHTRPAWQKSALLLMALSTCSRGGKTEVNPRSLEPIDIGQQCLLQDTLSDSASSKIWAFITACIKGAPWHLNTIVHAFNIIILTKVGFVTFGVVDLFMGRWNPGESTRRFFLTYWYQSTMFVRRYLVRFGFLVHHFCLVFLAQAALIHRGPAGR